MSVLTDQHRLWKSREYQRAVALGAIVLTSGSTLILLAREYLKREWIHTVSPPDLFLDLLPAMRMENVLVWGVPLMLTIAIIGCYLHPERLPAALRGIGMLLIVRAFFVMLTPMGIRPDQVTATGESFLQNIAYNSNDFFFSGHVSFPFMLALVFWNQSWLRNAMFAISGVFAVAVLLAHTHYSIDVFSVPFIAPGVLRLSAFLFGEDPEFAIDEQRSAIAVTFPSPT